jgi:L-2-hydroxyglutarate oxidase LhgO
MSTYDVCVIGGGIVGLAVGRALLERHPDASLLIIEKEDLVGSHQTGHNSGVIHSGLYYRPGSLKAEFAVRGAREMYAFCAEAGIPHQRSGKLVIATRSAQISALDELERRGIANGLEGLRRLRAQEIKEIEPPSAHAMVSSRSLPVSAISLAAY